MNTKREMSEASIAVVSSSSTTYDIELFPLLSLSQEETTVNIQNAHSQVSIQFHFYNCNVNICLICLIFSNNQDFNIFVFVKIPDIVMLTDALKCL